jgi:hypothetical protein
VKEADFEGCAALALIDGATMTNPQAVVSTDQVMAVYRGAL